MRVLGVFARLLGLHGAVVERVNADDGIVVVHAHPRVTERDRCGLCGVRSPGYDQGEGRRRWRALDLGTIQAYVEADAPRVRCRDHGVVVARVPWARHGAWHTRDFGDQAAWLATTDPKERHRYAHVHLLARGGRIITRVVADRRARIADPLAGFSRIGIDEVSFRRGRRYITGVICHDTGRLVRAAEGRDSRIPGEFFVALGPERCRQICLCRVIWAAGCARPLPLTARTRSCAWTPSTSPPWPPTPSTWCAGTSGARRGEQATPSARAG